MSPSVYLFSVLHLIQTVKKPSTLELACTSSYVLRAVQQTLSTDLQLVAQFTAPTLDLAVNLAVTMSH